MLWWVASIAIADPPAAATGDPPVVIVEGQRITGARDELVHELGEQGYDRVKDAGDHLVLRANDPWKGRILVYDDGWVRMRVPRVAQLTRVRFAGVGIAGGFNFFPTHGMIAGIEERALEPSRDAIAAYGDRVADVAVEAKVNALPPRLEALWRDGQPLDPGPSLVTIAERKAAILAYWESRTDTVWGDRVRDAIDAFVRAEVQTTDAAFTAAEIDAFNARRHCERPLETWTSAPDPGSIVLW
jgi:hypothetical protein